MKPKQRKTRCATNPDKWDRWHIRLHKTEDQRKVRELFRKSGAKTKSDYLRARLLGEDFKVITEDKSSEKYLQELKAIISLVQKIGFIYNEAVKTINSYHSVATAQRMLHKLEIYSETLIQLQEKAIKLTEMYSNTK